MSEVVNNIACSIIQVMTFIIFIKILFDLDLQMFKLRNFLSFLLLNIITMIIYSTQFNGISTLLVVMCLIILLIAVYGFNFSKAFLASGVFMLVLSLSDMLTSLIFINFTNFEKLRETYFIYANLSVSLMTIAFISIKGVRTLFLRVINACDTKKSAEIIIFLLLIIFAIILMSYITSNNFYLNKFYILCVFGIIIFFILTLIFFREKYQKEKIISKYDQLFEYVNTFEEWMDIENMNIHESKNQLATLREIVKNNKKAVDYIDNIIKERIDIGNEVSQNLKYIPKGGVKGLLYYKITIANNNGISMLIDASKNVSKLLSKLETEETKELCRLLGIFLDNAIEAAKESKNKNISCEIYNNDNILNIVISNSFNGNIELNKIRKNGYTSKGIGRGKGLYLAEKISNKSKIFSTVNRIINDYFVQKITVKK